MRSKSRRSGFTLPEVLVTVTVVAVLAAVVVPAVTQYAGKGDSPSTKNAINAINTAITSFTTDNRDFPGSLTDVSKYAGGLSFGSTATSSTATFPGYGSMVVKNEFESTRKSINGAPYLTSQVTTAEKKCGEIDSAIDDGGATTGIFQYTASDVNASPCTSGYILWVPYTK
jgi:prepilin-type N-terminal cleavage/methylation domain-containing protein